MCVPWKLNPQPFALLTQCSTTEPQEQLQIERENYIVALDSRSMTKSLYSETNFHIKYRNSFWTYIGINVKKLLLKYHIRAKNKIQCYLNYPLKLTKGKETQVDQQDVQMLHFSRLFDVYYISILRNRAVYTVELNWICRSAAADLHCVIREANLRWPIRSLDFTAMPFTFWRSKWVSSCFTPTIE